MIMIRKLLGVVVFLLFPLLLVLLYYTFYGVNGEQWSIKCQFHEITGWLCPGCGGQRAFYHLLHGNLLYALRCNALIVVLIPILLLCYYILVQRYVVGNIRFQRFLSLRPWYAYLILILLFLFFVLRNIPVSPFILLSPPV